MAGNYMQDLYEETFGKKPKTTAGTLYENAATPETAGFSRKRTYIDDLYDETFRKNPEAPLDVYGQRARVTNRWAAAPGHDDPAKVDQVQAELSKYLGDAAPPRGLLTLSQLEERLRIAKADAATGTAPYTAKWVVTEGENSRVPYGIPGLAAVENAFYKVSDAVRSALPKGHPDNKLDVNDPLYTYAAGPGAIVGYAAQAEPKALMRTIRDAPGLVGGGAVSGGAGFLGVLRMVSDNFENLDPPLMRVMKGIGETLKAHGYAPPVDYNEAGYVLMQLAEYMQGKTPEDAGPIERSARTALTSTGQVLPLLAASAAAGPTAAPYFAASMGVSAAGQTYLRRTKEDGPSASAAMHAVLDGIFEGAFEMAGGQVTLFDRAAWAKSFLGALAKMVAREVPSEVATTFMQNYDAWMFEHPEKSAKDWLAEQPQDALETALSTLMGAGVQSAIAHGTMAAVDRINGNHRAEKEASALHEMFAAATEAELFHSDPQRFEEFFQGASQNAEVRIDASVLGNALEAAGKTKDDIPALVEQGDLPGDITVPVASLVSTFAGTTEEGTIVQNVRMDPEAQTIAERRAAGNSALDAFMSAGRKALEERQADQRFKGAYDALKEELAADLGATGVYKPGAVDSFADMTATLYSVTASRMGVTPLQLRDGWTDSNGVEHRGYNLLARNQKGPIARPVANATMADFTPGRIGNILRRGNWAVITAENPQGKTLTPEENAARQVALKAELDRLGVEYEQIEGKYVEDGQEEIAPLEHPFLVLGMGTNDALALGNKFGRDSVLTREGVVYSDGTVHRAGSVTEHAVEPRNYWSRVPSTGATFTANLDFSKKVPLSDVQNSGELYQNVQEPQGTFSPDTLEYSLLAKADLSTFMHEVGHFALTMYMDLARDIESRVSAGVEVTAGEQGILDDMLAVLEWMGGEMPAVAGAPGVFEQKVWHGTPHIWPPEPGFPHGRPRLDKIGSGEGAQAYGWGFYLAQAKGVAKYYLMEQFGPMPPTGLLAAAVSIRHKYKDDAKKVAFMKQMWPEYSDKEIADAIAQSKELQPVNESSLYQLDIPDSTLPYLLDWDKPLSQQTHEVKKALAGVGITEGKSGEDIYWKVKRTRYSVQESMPASLVSVDAQKYASEYLASIGIVGNRYLDGQSRNRPLKDIKREFLAELPEDAGFDEVSDLIGTGRFSPKNDALLKALRDDEWLGFDYPAQAISAALSKDLGNYDTSPALLRAVADAQEGATFNFVIWDQPTLDEIAMLERNGEKLDAISAADLFPEEFADENSTITVDGKTRPTTNSNGKPIAQTEEGLRNFWRWFGDSKVVDAEGRPLVVYHGTAADFEKFKRSRSDIGMHFGTRGQAEDRLEFQRDRGIKTEEGMSILPVYLSAYKLLRLTDAGAWNPETLKHKLAEIFPEDKQRIGNPWSNSGLKTPKQVSDFLRSKGYSGVVYKNTGEVAGSTSYRRAVNAAKKEMLKVFPVEKNSFSPADQKVPEYMTWAAALKEYENFREENGEDSYVVFDPKQVASALGSTWVRGDVGANILKQGETPATPAPGKLTLAAWAAMSTEQQRPYHEKFAETWEQYLFTGKAPTKKMEGLMRRLSDWMRRVYITMKGLVAKRQLADLNPELSAVMDRMVATEQEISDALARRTSEALFRSAVEAGMTPEQFSAYMALSDSAKAEAEERLRARAMRDLKWMENRRNKAIAALQKEAAEARKKVREQVAKEVANTPLFRAIRWLRHGVIDNPDTGEEIQSLQGHKLKISDLEAMYPAGAVDSSVDWKKLGYGKYGMLAAEGLHPDIIAHMVGFQTGYELVSALIEAPSFKQEVEGITDQRMLSEHGDLATPEGIAKAADEAIMNDTRTKFLATELSRLVTHLGSPAAIARAAMAYAKATVDNHIVGKLRPNTFTADAARAGKASLLAFGKGDIDGAAAAKRTEILNHATAREAYAVEKEIKAMISKLQKMAQATDESAAAKARDMDVVNAVRVILSSYGIGSSAKGEQAATYLDNLRTLEPVIADELKGLVDAATQNKKDWKKLKVSELRDLFTDVSGVWELAKRSQQQVVDGKRVERASIVQQLVDRLQTRHPATQGASSGNRALTKAEQRKAKFSTVKALFRRVSDWAESMDGGRKMGPFRRYIWFPLKDAADRYRIDKEQKLTEYHALLEAVKDSFNGKVIDGRPYGVDYIFGGGEVDGMSELLHALLHTGNESNKRKLLLGRGWATKNADGTLDTVNWDRFIHAMQANGTLTKAHYDFVQGVWDLLESTKPLAQRAHRAVFGRSFNEITAEKFITPWGEYRGGYVPAQADTDKVTDAAARALANQANENMTYSFPLPASGFAKNRVEYNVPLRLDLRTLAGHLDKVLLFSHLAEPAADVRRLLMNKELAAELKRVDPSVVESMLTPWLERSAKQIIETQDPSNKGLARIFSVVRTRAGITAMMANFVNTLQQLTGFATIMSKVDGKYMMESLAQHVANPADSYAFVTENSNYMRLRLEQGSIAMSGDIVDVLTNPGKYDRAVDWVRKHAYFMQTGIDQVITPVMWTAVYKQALGEAEGTPAQRHLDAVRLANDAVAQTQGSQFAEEVAKFEVGSPFYRMFMQFTGFFNAQANWMGTEFAKVARDMGLKKGLGRGLYIYLLGAAIPAIVSEAIVQAFRGGPPDDDKDGEYLDDWISSLMLGTLRYQAAMAPVVGPAAMALANTFNNKSYDDRISTSPAISMIESSFQGVRELYDAVADNESSKKPSRVIMDSATLVSMVLGVPIRTLAKPFAYGADVEVGKVSPTGPLDYTRGLLTGVASPESKQ